MITLIIVVGGDHRRAVFEYPFPINAYSCQVPKHSLVRSCFAEGS